MGSIYRHGWQQAAFLALIAALFGAGCTQKLPARTALELMGDPQVLEAVIQRCNDLQSAALEDKECRNAREATRRLEAQQPPANKASADAQFERAREARRARDEFERRRREALEKIDPYTMPLAPDTSTPPPAAQSTDSMSAASLPNG
ncbi:MAG TPA: EexN family lipoprotein [Steroidobacteraceae bacterium]|nr:EexN family lipoprotein [Steroidobacteraceae bacterium]